MSLPYGTQHEQHCEHSYKKMEESIQKKLGLKRCADFRDPNIYSEYRPTPNPKNGKELHIPGYNFCGPGTQVEARLERGDYGVNKLDNACRVHDVDYMFHADDKAALIESDKKLATTAEQYEHELLLKQKNSSAISTFLHFIGLGSFIPSPIRLGLYGPLEYDRLAAKAVKNVFTGKGFIEGIGVMDPVKFAKGLTKKGETIDDSVEKGKELYVKYIDS